MGGSTLPTASTPGYTSLKHASGTFVTCVCLAKWLLVLERLALARGYIKYNLDILQLTGGNPLSGGTHTAGGVFDIKQFDKRIVADAREMGAPATWLRDMNFADGSPGNTHTHGVLSGCSHNWPARYQIDAQKAGKDGFGYMGLKGTDPHPDPKVYRTWQQGIAWAEAEIARITGTSTISKETDDMPTTKEIAASVWREDIIPSPDKEATNPTWGAQSYLRETFRLLRTVRAELAATRAEQKAQNTANAAAINALAGAVGTNGQAVLATVEKAVTDSLRDIRFGLAVVDSDDLAA